MFYREIIAVCSEIHTKHINTVCGQNVELWMINLAVHIVTTGLYRVNSQLYYRTNIYIYLIYCRNMRTGRWRGHVNVRRASNRRTEWQSAHRGYVICTPLPSTQNSAPCITMERWTRPSGTPQCNYNTPAQSHRSRPDSTAQDGRAAQGGRRTLQNHAQWCSISAANSSSANRGSSRILWEPKVVPIVSQINPVTPFHPVSLQVQWGMLQRTEMLQRARRNTIGRRNTRVRMTCRAFPLWLERQATSLLGKVCSQFSLRKDCLCFSNLHVHCIKVK